MLKTNTSKKIVQTHNQSGITYTKSVVSIVLIIALFRLSLKIMILKIEGKADRTAMDG